jgi:hypothetical protein
MSGSVHPTACSTGSVGPSATMYDATSRKGPSSACSPRLLWGIPRWVASETWTRLAAASTIGGWMTPEFLRGGDAASKFPILRTQWSNIRATAKCLHDGQFACPMVPTYRLRADRPAPNVRRLRRRGRDRRVHLGMGKNADRKAPDSAEESESRMHASTSLATLRLVMGAALPRRGVSRKGRTIVGGGWRGQRSLLRACCQAVANQTG